MNVDNITLEYLMNPVHYERFMNKNKNSSEYYTNKQKKLRFYKKRILSLTKSMLKNEYPSNTLKTSFENYTDDLIDYLEFLDKQDIMQEEYLDIDDNKTVRPNKDVLPSANKLLIKPPEDKINTLDNFVNKKDLNNENTDLPRKKTINIIDPKFKTKGIIPKKKNVIT